MVADSRERRLQTVCLLVLTAVALGAAFHFLRPVLVPFILAVFFTYCLIPVIDLLVRRFRWPRPVALIVTGILGCGVLVAIGGIVTITVQEMASSAPQYQEQLDALKNRTLNALPLESFGLSAAEISTFLEPFSEGAATLLLNETALSIMAILSNGLLVAIFVLFLLMGSGSPVALGDTWGRIEDSIKRYIVLKVMISACTGFIQGFILWLLGIEFYMVFGLMGFLLNFIPNIGPVVATLLPLPIVALGDSHTAVAVLAIVLPGVVHFVSGNVVEPRIMGDSLDLHPIAIVIALIFFGQIWGIVGMFLATPITAVLKILLEKIEFTRPVADVMAGRIDTVTTRLDRDDLFDDTPASQKASAKGNHADDDSRNGA